MKKKKKQKQINNKISVLIIVVVVILVAIISIKLYNYLSYKNTLPLIELKGEAVIVLGLNEKYKEPGYIAKDKVDGNITRKVIITGDKVDTSKPGVYKVHYNVKSKRGTQAIQVTRIINVNKLTEKISKSENKNKDSSLTVDQNKLKNIIKKEALEHKEEILEFNTVCSAVDFITPYVYAYYDSGEEPEREEFRPLAKVVFKEEFGIE